MTYLLSMLLFYQAFTGNSYAEKIELGWDKPIVIEYAIHPEHSQLQNGDITGDNHVNTDDLGLLNELTGTLNGWTVNGDVGHLYLDCYQLQRSGKEKHIKPCKRCCLTCTARKLKEN